MSEYVIEARGLTKSFGGSPAVDGLDWTVERGSACGLIGRNGAGKTTTLRMLMALLRPDAGSARILGRSLWHAPASHRERVAYVSQEQNLYPWMTLVELCKYASHLYSRWDGDYASRLAARFQIPARVPVGVLSGGEKRKASILLAVAARPEVLILDEPAAGLDPVARRELLDTIVEVLADRPEFALVFSSHIISDLERIVDHVAMMDRGRMALAGSVDDLKSRTRRVQMIFEGKHAPAGFRLPGAIRLDVDGPVVSAIVQCDHERDFEAIESHPDARVSLFPLGIEEIFIEVAGRSRRPEYDNLEVMS